MEDFDEIYDCFLCRPWIETICATDVAVDAVLFLETIAAVLVAVASKVRTRDQCNLNLLANDEQMTC